QERTADVVAALDKMTRDTIGAAQRETKAAHDRAAVAQASAEAARAKLSTAKSIVAKASDILTEAEENSTGTANVARVALSAAQQNRGRANRINESTAGMAKAEREPVGQLKQDSQLARALEAVAKTADGAATREQGVADAKARESAAKAE